MTEKPKDPGTPKTPQDEAVTDAIKAQPLFQEVVKDVVDEKPIEKPMKKKGYWRI